MCFAAQILLPQFKADLISLYIDHSSTELAGKYYHHNNRKTWRVLPTIHTIVTIRYNRGSKLAMKV